MTALKLRKIGNSVGAIFPQELLNQLDLREGDTLHVTKAPDGVRLTAHDPEFERQMEVARMVMREDRDVLRILAKN